MIEKFYGIMYNILNREREEKTVKLNLLNSQISIFLSDGIMNPSKYIDEINENFNDIFKKQIMALDLDDAPSDMPLVRYISNDGKYTYDFAKKRINFYISFDENNNISLVDSYIEQIYQFINNVILNHSSISRVGIAVNYYIDKNDNKHSYWVDKYNLPLTTDSLSEISYTVNNNFVNKGLKYNKLITLTNAKLKNLKSVPVVSIDINNVLTAKLSLESLNYIFNDLDGYKPDCLLKDLEKQCE